MPHTHGSPLPHQGLILTPRRLVTAGAALAFAASGCTTAHRADTISASPVPPPALESQQVDLSHPDALTDLDIGAAIRLTREKNPQLLAARHQLVAADAGARAAARMPNPELEIGVGEYDREGTGFDGAEIEAAISQSIELGGKRRLRKHHAEASACITRRNVEALEIELIAETHNRFVALLAAQRRRELAMASVELTTRSARAVTERVNAGKAAPLQSTKADAELQLAQITARESKQAVAIARADLGAMWGESAAQLESIKGTLELIPTELPHWCLSAPAEPHLPQLQAMDQEVVASQLALSEERAARIPNLNAAIGVQFFREDDTDAYTFGIGLPLPLFDRNRANIQAAEAQVAAAMCRRDQATIELNNQRTATKALLSIAHQRVRAYRESVIPAMQKAFEAAHEGYRQGRFDYLEMLDAQRELITSQQALTDAMAIYHMQLAKLQTLTTTSANDTGN